jgi:hypothetical protein
MLVVADMLPAAVDMLAVVDIAADAGNLPLKNRQRNM